MPFASSFLAASGRGAGDPKFAQIFTSGRCLHVHNATTRCLQSLPKMSQNASLRARMYLWGVNDSHKFLD